MYAYMLHIVEWLKGIKIVNQTLLSNVKKIIVDSWCVCVFLLCFVHRHLHRVVAILFLFSERNSDLHSYNVIEVRHID